MFGLVKILSKDFKVALNFFQRYKNLKSFNDLKDK